MKTRLLFMNAFALIFLFIAQAPIYAQQDCGYDFTLQCPARYQGCIAESPSSSNTGFPTFIRNGVLCDSVQFDYTDQPLGQDNCNKLFDRLWSATIPGSNTTRKCSQRIELFDNTAPRITDCPVDVTLTFPDSTHSWTTPTVTDNCESESITSSHESGSAFPLGDTEVIFTATDGCGNTNTCSFTVTVKKGCTTEFALYCPGGYTGCIGDDIDPSVIGTANTSHTGDFCGSKTIKYVDDTISHSACLLIIDRKWTATATQNSESKVCTQSIELKDDEGPTFSTCPPNVNLDTPNTALNWLDPIVSDNCGGVHLSSNYNSGAIFPEGQTTVIYTATDDCGNINTCSFIVNVVTDTCDQNFDIICPSNFYGCLGESIDPFDTGQANVTHSGNFCGGISITFEDTTLDSTSTLLKIQRVWYATTLRDGTKKGCAQIITLKDDEGPTIHNCPADITLEMDDAEYTWTLPTASDNCTSVTLESSHANGSTFPKGTTTVIYTATDDNGNSTTCSFTITVKGPDCYDDFSITCPPIYKGCRDDSTDSRDTGRPSIHHSGNVCGNIIVTSDDKIITNSDCKLVIEREWTATVKESGTKKTCIQKIILEDDDKPVIYNCPQNVVLNHDDAQYTWTLPTASDNCSTVTLESSIPNGSTFPIGITTVLYSATDDCGNKSSCSFEVKVKEDNTGGNLIVNCPDDINLDCGEDLHHDTWPLPEVNSSCGSCDDDYSSKFIDMGSLDGHKYYCSKFTATWQEAAEHARRMGGHLVIINNEYENKMLSEFLEVRSAFIGLSDHEVEGQFKWTNGSPVTYSNWYPGQPNDYKGKQDYVELLDDGYWNDQYSYKKLEFIVELPCLKIEQIAGPSSPKNFQGSHATIKYKVTDGCGNMKTCEFDVTRSGGLDLNCPSDIEVDLSSNHDSKQVTWEEPTAQTCCDMYCDNHAEIDGFVFMGSRNGHKYYCSKDHLKWHDAQKECEKHGGYLAVIDDEEENKMLANFLVVQSAFIGLSDYHDEGNFTWVNGAGLNYTNWYPGQPNNYYNDQHFVEMLNNGQWNDQYSHKKREYIMEIPGCSGITQVEGPTNGSSLSAGNYTVKYKATDACGNMDMCSFNITVKGGGSNDLCHAGPSNSHKQWIESAQFGDYKKVSGNDDGYGNYSSSCIPITKGKVTNIQLSAGSLNYTDALYWAIFIDWNEDGYYSQSERIAKGRSKVALKGSFIFSESLPTGKFKLRVTLNTYGYQDNGCETVAYGEVEDYCISIKDPVGYFTSKDVFKSQVNMAEVVMESFELINEDDKAEITFDNIIENITVHPNPFVDKILINGPEFNAIKIWTLEGKLVRSIDLSTTTKYQADIGDLNSGTYLLEVVKLNGYKEIKKVIKH